MTGSQSGTGATLLERETQLAAVGEALGQARGGEGAMVAVEGAAGLGKTSLLTAAPGRRRRAG